MKFPEGKFPPKKPLESTSFSPFDPILTSIFTTIVTIALKPHVGFQPLNILHQSSYNPIKSPLITINSLFISYRTRFIVYRRIQLQNILSLFWWIQFITLLYQYVHQIDTIRYITRCILVITIFHSDMVHFSDQYNIYKFNLIRPIRFYYYMEHTFLISYLSDHYQILLSMFHWFHDSTTNHG